MLRQAPASTISLLVLAVAAERLRWAGQEVGFGPLFVYTAVIGTRRDK